MAASTVIFYVLSALALLCGVMVIWSRHVLYSAVYLVLSFLCLAGLYVLLTAEFVAAVQVLVYAGGIVILFLFLIMLVNLKDALTGRRLRVHAVVSGAIGAAVMAQILYVYSRGEIRAAAAAAPALAGEGNLQAVGKALYTDYVLPFEIASVLLLVAMIGAIVLARQKA
jgi:NADH-quinone oxidoreductase subunit J